MYSLSICILLYRLLEMAVNRERDGIFLVFEYCEHDLSTLLEHIPKAFSESEVKTLTMQLLSAVAYMHRHWIIHRDIKMSNLLYNNKGELKVADFGLARTFSIEKKGDMTRTAPMTPIVVTLWYRSPELLLRPQHSDTEKKSNRNISNDIPPADIFSKSTYETGVDLWACGCVMAELLRGGVPLLPGNSEIDQVCVPS